MVEDKKQTVAKIDADKQAKLKAKVESADKDEELKNKPASELRAMLSNKNKDYVFRLQRALVKEGLSQADAEQKVDALLAEIVVAQHHGQPANGLYMASPSVKAQAILHPEVKPKTMMDFPFWQRAVDNILLWMAIFMALYGVMGLSNSKVANAQNGLLTVIIMCVLLGLFWAKYNEWMMPEAKSNKPKIGWLKLIIYFVIFVFFLMIILGLVSLKAVSVINPVLPGIVYLILAAIAFGGRYLFRKQYGITGNILMPTPSRPVDKK